MWETSGFGSGDGASRGVHVWGIAGMGAPRARELGLGAGAEWGRQQEVLVLI